MKTKNNETAFNKIYDSTNKKVLALITAKCCNTEDISDIFQETYIELYSVINNKGVDYIENPEAFLAHIVKQKIYRHYSVAQRFKMQISLHQLDKDGKEFDISDTVINEMSVEESYVLKEEVDEITSYLNSKPQITKKIFHLYYSLDKSIPEIAELLEIGQSSVKNHIYRTLKDIQENFKKEEGVAR